MKAFCTIVTSSHVPFAVALFESYWRYANIPLEVLCVDRKNVRFIDKVPDGLKLRFLDEVVLQPVGDEILVKYANESDALRWSLKSVWMYYLLTTGGYNYVAFTDPDLFFFGDPVFLFDEIENSSVLLSPHWRSSDPVQDPFNFELNFRDGIYNGGFIGASTAGLNAFEWLATACLYKCERTFDRGLFVDQKYLDLLPTRFDNVKFIRHKGCNVANWNQVDCKRHLVDGRVLINGEFPVVFIHFTQSTIRGIVSGEDHLLEPYLREYQATVNRIDPTIPILPLAYGRKQARLIDRVLRFFKS